MTCNHNRVGHIKDLSYWVCADCLATLAERPTKYGLSRTDGLPNGLRQEIKWQAEIAKSGEVLFSDFLDAMARRIAQRTKYKMPMADAFWHAISMMRSLLPDKFGDAAYDWDLSAAKEIVDCELDCWEQDGSERN